MYELIKSLSLLVYPLGISLSLSVLGMALLFCRWRRAGMAMLGSGLLVLWGFATPLVADRLLGALEGEWPDRPVEALPAVDAVLVLGGTFGTGNGQFVYPSTGGSVDRYWHAARLFHAGRAPVVVLSGGRQPHRTAGLTEAEAGALFLIDMGVPREALILETQALTTRAHSLELAPLLAEHEVSSLLVVTSASHMRRAMLSLSGLEASLLPAASDFSVFKQPGFQFRRLLPSVNALSRSTRAIHEFIGILFYRLRGWA